MTPPVTNSCPSFSKRKVNWAGKIYAAPMEDLADYMEAIFVIDDWRAAHRLPTLMINNFVRSHTKRVNSRCIVAQRLKRISSIKHKLDRFPKMSLARMQDIGGCRIVAPNIGSVLSLEKRLRSSRTQHLITTSKNYIDSPKASGYRGIHLVYQFQSSTHEQHCGLKVEVQIRTSVQHVWATGVETVGTFLNSPLKSSIGPDEWLKYFSYLSEVLHFKEMNPRIFLKMEEFHYALREFDRISAAIDAERRLGNFGAIVNHAEKKTPKGTETFVLHLKPAKNSVLVYSFNRNQQEHALQLYSKLENAAAPEAGEDIVLVSVDSLNSLRKAYPNYFLDTKTLLREIANLKKIAS